MNTLPQQFPDLRFTPSQFYFTDDEYRTISRELLAREANFTLTDRDKAFLQAALFVAVDTSEKASWLFELYRAATSAAISQSLRTLVSKLAQSGAKQAFSNYIDDTPKYSAVGRAGILYSAFGTEWRIRVGTGDASMLSNFLAY